MTATAAFRAQAMGTIFAGTCSRKFRAARTSLRRSPIYQMMSDFLGAIFIVFSAASRGSGCGFDLVICRRYHKLVVCLVLRISQGSQNLWYIADIGTLTEPVIR